MHQQHKSIAVMTQCVAIDFRTIKAVQVVDKIGQQHVQTATTTQSDPPHTRAEGGESRVSGSQHQQHKSMAMLTQCVAIDTPTIGTVQVVDKMGQEHVHTVTTTQSDRPCGRQTGAEGRKRQTGSRPN